MRSASQAAYRKASVGLDGVAMPGGQDGRARLTDPPVLDATTWRAPANHAPPLKSGRCSAGEARAVGMVVAL